RGHRRATWRRIRPDPWLPSIRPLLGRGHDARRTEEPEHGVGRLGALRQPRLGLLPVDHELDRLRARVVVADDLDGPTVAGAPAVGDDDAVGRLLGRADARQPDASCHGCLVYLLRDSGRWGAPPS